MELQLQHNLLHIVYVHLNVSYRAATVILTSVYGAVIYSMTNMNVVCVHLHVYKKATLKMGPSNLFSATNGSILSTLQLQLQLQLQQTIKFMFSALAGSNCCIKGTVATCKDQDIYRRDSAPLHIS